MQTRERIRKRHRNTTKKNFRVSVNTSTHPKNLAQRSIRVVLLHCVATHIDKDHQREHVIGTAQNADTKTNVRGHRELRQYTRADRRQGTPIVGVESAGEKRTHMKFALPTLCKHKTRPTWHRPHLKQSNCASPYGVARRDISRNLTHRPCLSNGNVSKRHGTSLLETHIMTSA